MSEQLTLNNTKNSETVGKTQEMDESPIEDWKLVKLGKILSLEYGDNLTEEEREEGEIPVYGSNGRVGWHNKAYVKGPGIILGRKGSIAETEFSSKPFYPIDTTYYVSNEETDQNLRFLNYLLNHLQLERFNAASAIPGLNRTDVYNLKTILPPVPEQRKIASVLYNVDRAIQKTEEIIEQTKRVKKGLMQDIIFDGIGHDEYQDVQFGPLKLQIPEEWEIRTVRSVLELLTDYEANGSFNELKENVNTYKEQNYAWYVRATDLENNNLPGSGEVKYTDKESYDFLEKSYLEGGELMMSKRGQIGKIYMMPDVDMPATIAPNMYLLRLDNEEIVNKYLYYYFLSDIGRRQLERRNASTTIGAIYKEDLKKIKFPLPPIQEQKKIVPKIENIDKKIKKEKEQKEQLQRLKKGLMQDLLTGEVRAGGSVEVLDEVVEVED